MAGTIPLSMTQQLDEFGAPLAGGHLYLIQAGTVSTPQNAYQDSALTLAWPNPIILDAAGRLPQFFLADGSIKIRLTDVNGNEKLIADGLLSLARQAAAGVVVRSMQRPFLLQAISKQDMERAFSQALSGLTVERLARQHQGRPNGQTPTRKRCLNISGTRMLV